MTRQAEGTVASEGGRSALLAVLLALVGLAWGCDQANPVADAGTLNTAFPGTELIREITPTQECVVSTTPSFAWEATGRGLVHVGVFDENLDISASGIANRDANRWFWHTGLSTGREGNVTWNQGVSINAEGVVQDLVPEALEHGTGYVWAVWAWEEGSLEVVASSPEIFFVADSTAEPVCR